MFLGQLSLLAQNSNVNVSAVFTGAKSSTTEETHGSLHPPIYPNSLLLQSQLHAKL